MFVRTSVADNTERQGGRSAWLYDLDLVGGPLQMLHPFLLCSASSHRLLCSQCEWLPDDDVNISLAPLPCISGFSPLAARWKGGATQSCLLPLSLLGHPAEAGQAV